MAVDTHTSGQQERLSLDTLLIDADVHEQPPQGFKRMLDLIPYLDPHWARYVSGEGGVWTGMPLGSSYLSPLAKNGVRGDWKRQADQPGGGGSLEAMVEELIEGEGVTTPILNGQLWYPTAMPGDPEFAAALAAAYNDYQIEHWLDPEPRFMGSVHIASQLPEVAAKEIDRVAEHPRIVQVILPLATNLQWGDPMYRPIWEAAIRNNLAVAFHHGGNTSTALGWPRYYIEWHTVASPHAAQCQVMSLIVNGTFDKYPELKCVILECGGTWVHWLMWRLDQQFREARAGTPWVKKLPSEHIRGNVRVATQPITEVTPGEFEALVEMTQTHDVFVYASDYPHYDADSADVLNGLSEDLRMRIRCLNALETWPRLKGLLTNGG